MPFRNHPRLLINVILGTLFLQITSGFSAADGLLVKKRDYQGSLEEASQEAIIIFEPAAEAGLAIENLILSVEVHGDAREFAWVIPFPHPPEAFAADAGLFQELFEYIEHQRQSRAKVKDNARTGAVGNLQDVELITRNIVGNYEIAVVRENEAGGLNPWLAENGYQPLDHAADVLDFYRRRNYVYACIKYSRQALAGHENMIHSHPIRFQFKTGGRDGIYFPMKLTGLQQEPFDVTLHVFSPSWLNDQQNQFGFVNRGFSLTYRDWDTVVCDPNAGKLYSSPQRDPFLKPVANKLKRTSALFQALYPGRRFYLTRLQATQLDPGLVRAWSDDLWLFPFYNDTTFVPFDIRTGGVASTAWPNPIPARATPDSQGSAGSGNPVVRGLQLLVIVLGFIALLVSVPLVLRKLLVR